MGDPLSVAGTAVGVVSLGIQVTQSLFQYYTALKSQNTDIRYTMKKIHDLLETFKCLSNHIDNRRFRADEEGLIKKIESHIEGCEEIIKELEEEAVKFKETPIVSIRSAIQTTVRRAAYPLRQSTLKKLEEDVDDVTYRLQLTLQLLQQEVIDRVQDDIEDVKALLKLVGSSQRSTELQIWFKAPDATINFNEAHKKKHPRTGLWLVQGKAFKNWLDSPKSFLWLRGFAGCGKSVLCSTAIQFAFRHRRSDPRTGVAFFFFTFSDESKQDASAMLRALILQLSTQHGNYDGLSRLHDMYPHGSPPDDALLDCLYQLVRTFHNVYILLDALDESPRSKHREDVLQVLREIRAWEEPSLHLLVTSRDEVDIRNELQALPEESLAMANSEVDQDIATFVAQHLRERRQLRKWEKHYDRIQETLTNRANGVFRWVECQFKSLEICPPIPRLLEGLLQSLPRSLDETYARMLENIAPDLRDYARQMLTVLCCAIRPLTELELIDALAVKLGERPTFDTARRCEDADALQDVCPGFTERYIDLETGQSILRIAHFSVREYLESERILDHKSVALFHVRKQDGHSDMASICLALLLDPELKKLSHIYDLNGAYPLARYSAEYWHTHVSKGTLRNEIEVQTLELFRDTKGTFKSWVRLWNDYVTFNNRDWIAEDNPIYAVAYLGLAKTLSELLGGDRSMILPILSTSTAIELINTKGGAYGTALHVASYQGYTKMVNILLEHGANINADGDCCSALELAIYVGNETMVRLLLDKGADINSVGPNLFPFKYEMGKNIRPLSAEDAHLDPKRRYVRDLRSMLLLLKENNENTGLDKAVNTPIRKDNDIP
ncbi:hypothetical protein F5Y12DRAFT_712073 [Xylaria sp. FL1777]|nr:hypothetical protein F5Y12DRAFT_712073 [Xylaria sp. FL1777]